MPIYPDATLHNADWPKRRTWDLTTDLAIIAEWPIEALEQITRLPVWDAAPDRIRTFIEDRLALDPAAGQPPAAE